MRVQNQWLFEVIASDIDRAASFPNETEWEVQSNDRQGFVNLYGNAGHYLDSGLEEEYRRYNRRFRREMVSKIGNVANHPLKFLVKQGQGKKWVFRTAKDRRVDAGHVTPVITMRKRGHRTERLAIQDRTLNRSDGAKMGAAGKGKRIKVVDVAGVPVDIDTVKKYVRLKLLDQAWLKAKTDAGWKVPGNKELEFALGEFHDWISLPDRSSVYRA